MMHKKGFTLIELLVAIALFAIIISIAVGGFVDALRTQRQVSFLLATQSNVSLALEQMAREIRTGYLFCHDAASPPNMTCSCTVASGVWTCSNLDFYNANSQDVQYRLTGGSLEKGISNANYQSITGDNVSVKYLTFVIFGNTEGDQWNPRITITLGVAPSSSDPGISNDVLNLQTSISAREIDCSVSTSTGVSC